MSKQQQLTAKRIMNKRSTLPQPLWENMVEEFSRGNESANISTEAFNAAVNRDDVATDDLLKRKVNLD